MGCMTRPRLLAAIIAFAAALPQNRWQALRNKLWGLNPSVRAARVLTIKGSEQRGDSSLPQMGVPSASVPGARGKP